MSKRHRKTKDFAKASHALSGADSEDWYQAPKGRKPKGRERRRAQKLAFYDMD